MTLFLGKVPASGLNYPIDSSNFVEIESNSTIQDIYITLIKVYLFTIFEMVSNVESNVEEVL